MEINNVSVIQKICFNCFKNAHILQYVYLTTEDFAQFMQWKCHWYQTKSYFPTMQNIPLQQT